MPFVSDPYDSRIFFLFFITLMFVAACFLHSNWRVLVGSIGLYALLVYWAYGYEWSSGAVLVTKYIVGLRRLSLLLAYASFNVLAAYNAYSGDIELVIYFILWFVVTSALLPYKWLEIAGSRGRTVIPPKNV